MTSFGICKLNLSDHVDIMAVNGTLTDIQLIRRKAVFIFITHENGRYVQQHFNNHNSCRSRPLNGANTRMRGLNRSL